MDTATFVSIDATNGICTYELSDNLSFNTRLYGENQTHFEVYSRQGFTKVRLNGVEVHKSLGAMSHKEMLYIEGYKMKVAPDSLTNLSDEELVRLWEEFDFTGDDASAVVNEINNR